MQLLSHLEMWSRVHQGQLNARDWTQAYPVLQVYNKQKKPKVPEQKTYAQAAAGISRVAIVPMAYPDRRLDVEEVVVTWSRVLKPRSSKAPLIETAL